MADRLWFLWLSVFMCLVESQKFVQQYRRHRLLLITPKTEAEVKFLSQLMLSDPLVDFWTLPALGQPVHINVSPQKFGSVARLFHTNGIPYRSALDDIQRLIDREANELRSSRSRREAGLSLSAYNDWKTITTFIQELNETQRRRDTQLLTVSSIATTHEGRPVYLINFNNPLINSTNKPTIILDGGLHAREWISVSVVLFLLQRLSDAFLNDEQTDFGRLARQANWFLVPVANPDGFVYSWTSDRLWRKNRSPGEAGCVGVDLNRNFPFAWGEGSSSSAPCSDLYRGPNPFSEAETKGFRDWIEGLSFVPSAYLSYHSYYQTWMYPWGSDPKRTSPNQRQLEMSAFRAIEKVRLVHDRHYNVLSAATVPSPVGGTSGDWLKAAKAVPLVYTVELRPRCYSSDGFLLPQAQILPVAEEMLAGVQAIVEDLLALQKSQ